MNPGPAASNGAPMNRAARAAVAPALRTLFAGHGRSFALGAALAVLTVAMGIGLLGLSGWFITATALAGLQAATAIVFDVFMPSAGIRLLALGRTFSRYGERIVTHDATLGLLARLREQLFRGWAQRAPARALALRPARLLFRLTADIDALEALYLRLLVPALSSAGAALLAGLIVGLHSPWLGLALALWLCATGCAVTLWLARRSAAPSARRAVALESMRGRAADLVAGQTELLMAGRLDAQRQAIAAADARMARTDDRLNRLEARAVFVQGATGAATLAAMVLAAGWLVGEAQAGAPVAALCILVALAAGEPFAALRRGALDAGRTALALRRLAPAMDAAHEGSVLAAPADGCAVCIEHAEVRHPGASRAALPALSLQVGVGERVALVGPSGAGKSTLLALVAGEVGATQGGVQALPASWLTQRIDLFEDSLRDNLRVAAPRADDEALRAALDDAGLGADVAALRAQLDTPLGEGGLGLSGGQARRLALARLFLHARPLWLLDEATEALDAATARDLLARLRVRAAGHTLLIATHLRREAALADRLLRIEHGRVTQDLRRGTPEFEAALSALRPD